MKTLAQKLRAARQKSLKPKPQITVVQWADENRILPPGSAISGPWQTSRIEPARAPMLAVTEAGVKKISIMGPSQLLKTELLLNVIGYFTAADPAPMILMQPDLSTADAFSKDRLSKLIDSTPALAELFDRSQNKKDAQNSLRYKPFAGGSITLVGSHAPSALAMRAVRVVLVDEIDRAAQSAGHEGSPLSLLEKRTTTFWNALSIRVSSPTINGESAIEAEYLKGDQRVWHSKCQHCQSYVEPLWEQVEWVGKNSSTASYHCQICKAPWTEPDRHQAIKHGKYIAQGPFNGHASFKLNALASPWTSVKQLVDEWLEAQDNTELLKTFINTRLAQSWVIKGEKPDAQRLFERREQYTPNTIPSDKIMFLTAGVDVQKDRLELEVVGWCKDKSSYSIDYRTIYGPTHTTEPWIELEKLLDEAWKSPSGRQMQLSMMAVDSGYNTSNVYEFVRAMNNPRRVRAVKGSDSLLTRYGTPKAADVNSGGQRLKRGLNLWTVGSSVLKDELFNWLRLSRPATEQDSVSGYLHFPEYDFEHFKRLTAEQRVEIRTKGKVSYAWQKTQERNEQLDVRVYAMAGAAMFGLYTMTNDQWAALVGEEIEPQAIPAAIPTPQAPAQTFANSRPQEAASPANSIWNKGPGGKKGFW